MRRMKRVAAALLIIALFAFLLGTAPVYPTKGLYVNDYAQAIFKEHQEVISETSEDIELKTGIQVIVTTVKNLDGLSPDEYAEKSLSVWDRGGIVSRDSVLILYSRDEQSLCVDSIGRAAGAVKPRVWYGPESGDTLSSETASAAILACYEDIALKSYELDGYDMASVIKERIAKSAAKKEASKIYNMTIFIVLALLVGLRGLHVSRKYRKKYMYTTTYKRRSFRVERKAFDESAKDGIKDYDGKK